MRTIAMTQPDLVMVELCPSRISILSMDEQTLLREASDLNTQKILTTVKQVLLLFYYVQSVALGNCSRSRCMISERSCAGDFTRATAFDVCSYH